MAIVFRIKLSLRQTRLATPAGRWTPFGYFSHCTEVSYNQRIVSQALKEENGGDGAFLELMIRLGRGF